MRPGSGRRRERTIEGATRVAGRFECTVAMGACYASDGRFVYEYKGDGKEEKKQLKSSQSGIPYPNKDIPILSATPMRPLMDMSEKSSQAAERGVSYHQTGSTGAASSSEVGISS